METELTKGGNVLKDSNDCWNVQEHADAERKLIFEKLTFDGDG